ncbi:MAG TPA: SLC13 family permease [Gammaproteobacteria bacterium]|nr:SLC13 family permease [Gammaproteobacteria bacterium]
MSLPGIVLGCVLALIAARQIGPVRVAPWQAMLAGAAVVLLGGSIGPGAALRAIDARVMVFLFGTFVIGEALLQSGYLYVLAYRASARLRSPNALLWAIVWAAGLGSCLLMNDSLAIVGTPLVLRLAREHELEPEPMLLALAFAVTTGSIMSPIGNPQNLLIAVHGTLGEPFVTFLRHLALPTLLSLCLTGVGVRLCCRLAPHGRTLVPARVELRDPQLARLARAAVLLVVALILVKIIMVIARAAWSPPLWAVAAAGAAPVLAFSPARGRLLRRLDWPTLVFFAAMFVLMQSVWQTGELQRLLGISPLPVTSTAGILVAGATVSQLISNVPMVALYLPLLQQAGAHEVSWLALAAGSTLAGNLTLLGAASNIIVVQGAERLGVRLSFRRFARVGIPLTVVQIVIFWWLL